MHTPGPWTIERHVEHEALHTIWSDRTLLVARTCFAPNSAANALLIAAAPDLLDACRAALDWSGLDGDHISEPVRGQLLAAIAKAEGRI